MLEYIVIFSKGGVVLWNYNPYNSDFFGCINALINEIILEGRHMNSRCFAKNNFAIHFKLDNEFELVFAAVFQKDVKLSYVDILLDDLHLTFKKNYQGVLMSVKKLEVEYEFTNIFEAALSEVYNNFKTNVAVKQMRTFNESTKSQKNISSITKQKVRNESRKVYVSSCSSTDELNQKDEIHTEKDTILVNRKKLKEKLFMKKKSPQENKKKIIENDKQGKKPRVWDLEGNAKDAITLDRSRNRTDNEESRKIQNDIVGTMQGAIPNLEEDINNTKDSKKRMGILSYFKGIVGSKILTLKDLQPILDKMREHLIDKNVAADIAEKLCQSVATNLEGKSLGTLDSTASFVKNAFYESLLNILSPKRRIDIIRDALESKINGKPYVITFCGVNGVGKSTNLAKICFWLIENDFSVLIAACDTFRAGAVEQLRTHKRHINSLHPAEKHNRIMVELYEKGYGKDSAGVAMEAIKFANEKNIDVVLIDTAGRMQDNEPLMRSLSKLIKVNNPNLVLFVGEALVGNEAVDQLVRFNQSLADFSSNEDPHIIDGIVLTKFDTIDDKVGAAISMTYVTGQPIVFVGTGQTYTDLKALNINAVVNSLMK